MKPIRIPYTRIIAVLLVLACMLGLLPATALAASPSTIDGGGTVTVTASDQRLPNLTILKRDCPG